MPALKQRGIATPFAWITVVVVLVIAYGSLYPFSFHSRPDSPLAALRATYKLRDSRGDIIANILLYLPFGFFAVQALRRGAGAGRASIVTLAGMILSTAMEVLQFYIPGRESTLADIGTNTVGSLLGAGVGTLLHGRSGLQLLRPIRKHLSGALILACWLGYRLFPYVPDIDLHKYWHAVRPLLVAPVLRPLDLYRHTVIWLLPALVLDELCGAAWKRFAFPLLAAMVLCARIAIVNAVLSPAEVLGAALALLCWVGLLRRLRVRNAAIFALFVVLVILEALEPFRFTATARPFTWVPFHGFLQGSVAVNIQSFLEKTLLYGGLVWLAMRAGFGWRTAVLICGCLVFVLRLMQVYIPGRSAEISDVVILLTVSAAIRLVDRETRAV